MPIIAGHSQQSLMHFPLSIQIGADEIALHQLVEMLSYFVGYRYYVALRKGHKSFLSRHQTLWIIIAGATGAAIGSKLLGFLEHPQIWGRALLEPMYFISNKTIVGGLLGGVIGVELCKKYFHITRSTGDLFCFPVILGMIIGRIGCFLAGAEDGTWGLPTALAFGMDGGDGVMRHPTPLYEIIFLLLLWSGLARLKHLLPLQEGALFRLFMASYLAWRFFIEFLKPGTPLPLADLTSIQLACALGLIYYKNIFFRPRSLLSIQNGQP